jgi:hypothetical protein
MTQHSCRRPCSLLCALSQLEGNCQTISHSSPWPSQRLQQLQPAMEIGAAIVLAHAVWAALGATTSVDGMSCAGECSSAGLYTGGAVRCCRWAFDAVLDVLAVQFRSSFAANTSSSTDVGTLQAAAALSALAKGVHSDQQASLAMCKRLLILHNNAGSNLLSPPQQRSAEHDPALAAAALRQLTPALAMAVQGASSGVAAHSSQELLPVAAFVQAVSSTGMKE